MKCTFLLCAACRAATPPYGNYTIGSPNLGSNPTPPHYGAPTIGGGTGPPPSYGTDPLGVGRDPPHPTERDKQLTFFDPPKKDLRTPHQTSIRG